MLLVASSFLFLGEFNVANLASAFLLSNTFGETLAFLSLCLGRYLTDIFLDLPGSDIMLFNCNSLTFDWSFDLLDRKEGTLRLTVECLFVLK
jgi:hypothetical protein